MRARLFKPARYPSVMRVAPAIGVFPASPSAAGRFTKPTESLVGGPQNRAPGSFPAVVSFKTTRRVPWGSVAGDTRGRDFAKRIRSPRARFLSAGRHRHFTGADRTEQHHQTRADLIADARFRIAFAGITIEELAISRMSMPIHTSLRSGIAVERPAVWPSHVETKRTPDSESLRPTKNRG